MPDAPPCFRTGQRHGPREQRVFDSVNRTGSQLPSWRPASTESATPKAAVSTALRRQNFAAGRGRPRGPHRRPTRCSTAVLYALPLELSAERREAVRFNNNWSGWGPLRVRNRGPEARACLALGHRVRSLGENGVRGGCGMERRCSCGRGRPVAPPATWGQDGRHREALRCRRPAARADAHRRFTNVSA